MAPKMCKQKSRLTLILAVVALGGFCLLWQTGALRPEWYKDVYSSVTEQFQVQSSKAPTAFVFLKTHKTGGSAIQNLCMRYALAHDLLIALPREHNYFGHPKQFNKSMVGIPRDGRHYQVFAHHTRFNYNNIKDLMPEGAVFFTIMREPASLFESAYAYYGLGGPFRMPLEEFVSQDKSAMAKYNDQPRPANGRIGLNQMTFDLGGDVGDFDDEDAIRRMADKLDGQFQLVMIMERMNESLVLLKNLLSWTTDDVVVMRVNARQDSAKKALTPEVKAKISEWNKADVLLYEYFFKKFDDKVKAFGEDRMRAEVQELQERTDQWYDYCVAGVKRDTSAVAANIEGIDLTNAENDTCKYLVIGELEFTSELAQRQEELVSWV